MVNPSEDLEEALIKWYEYMKSQGDSDQDLFAVLLVKIKKLTKQR